LFGGLKLGAGKGVKTISPRKKNPKDWLPREGEEQLKKNYGKSFRSF